MLSCGMTGALGDWSAAGWPWVTEWHGQCAAPIPETQMQPMSSHSLGGEAWGWARESEKDVPYLTLFSFVTHARNLAWNKTINKKSARGPQEGRKDGAYMLFVSRSLRLEGSIGNKKPPEKSLPKTYWQRRLKSSSGLCVLSLWSEGWFCRNSGKEKT